MVKISPVLLGVCALCWQMGWAAAEQPPNVLLVTIDTLRADHIGAYGARAARTPHLDELAAQGVRFERAFSPVPLTLPAHASLMTGLYPPGHGVRDNAGFVLAQTQVTLAEMLSSAGYSTAAVVGAFVLHSKFGLAQGFDHYSDDFDLSLRSSRSPGYIQRPGREVVDEALARLQDFDQRPFFLWVHLYDPHDPYTPPEPYASRHPGRPYDGEIEYADAQVGRLLQALRSRSDGDRTLIVVAGDHGESLGQHGELKHGFFVYNAVLHVPLIVRLPQGRQAGTVVGDNVSLVDVVPTVAQVLGLRRHLPSRLHGRGLLSLMLGKKSPVPDLYAETFYPRYQFGWAPLQTLIQGRRKYIRAPRAEVFDLDSDFAEERDLATANQALADGLAKELKTLTSRIRAGGPSASSSPSSSAAADSETLSRLASLGYVSLSLGGGAAEDIEGLADPKDRIEVYNRIGRLLDLSQQGRHREALPEYRRFLLEDPDLKLVRYKLGQSYYETGRFPEAAEEFKKVIQDSGQEALAIYDLALCYLRMKRWQDAADGFELTLKRDPTHGPARLNLGVAYRALGRLPESIAALERAVEAVPGDTAALANLGISYSLVGRHREAVEVLEKAVAIEPENARLHANLAAAYGRSGDAAKAAQHMARAKKLNPALFPGKRP